MWRAVTGAGGGGRRRRPFHCPRSRIPSQQKQGSGGGRAGLSVDLALAGLRRVAAASDWASAFLEKRAFFFFSSSFLSSDVGGNSLEARPRLRIPAFPGLSLRSARLSLSLSLSSDSFSSMRCLDCLESSCDCLRGTRALVAAVAVLVAGLVGAPLSLASVRVQLAATANHSLSLQLALAPLLLLLSKQVAAAGRMDGAEW